MVKIYHNKEFILMNYFFMGVQMKPEEAEQCMLKPENLEEVAEMTEIGHTDIESLETAFRMTQNYEANWTRNFEVSGFVPAVKLGTAVRPKLRSTSVGDVMELNGKFYIVAICGFEEIGNPFEDEKRTSIFDDLDPETGMWK